MKPFKSELGGAKRNLVVLATNQATSASNLHSIQSTTPKKLRPAGVLKKLVLGYFLSLKTCSAHKAFEVQFLGVSIFLSNTS